MTNQVRIVKEGSEPPHLIVVHYPKGEERHINPVEDTYLFMTPDEACMGGTFGEIEDLLSYAQAVIRRAKEGPSQSGH